MATLERTYTIPLRREFLKASRYKRAKKAGIAVREFLVKHMKSEDVRVGTSVNLEVWKHGIRNPPSRVKVIATKDDKGVVRAELFGAKLPRSEKKADKKVESKEVKAENKVEQKPVEVKPAPKAEFKK